MSDVTVRRYSFGEFGDELVEMEDGAWIEAKDYNLLAAQAQPVWTRDKPTVAGWYWWRFTADSRYVVFDLTEKNGVLYRRDDSGKLWEYPEDGEWAGPLALPRDAQGRT